MIIQKLRLQRGWSQDQLAQLSGLSTRTIQRIERGQPASLESQKSLAAVFEINLTQIQQEPEMNATTVNPSTNLLDDEKQALNYVRKLKGFYAHAMQYAVVIPLLFVINHFTSPNYMWAWWPMLGWGIGLGFHAFRIFSGATLFSPQWEKAQVEKHLGRKL